ncbi:restriction endonuclease subunit S [Fusobacterium sp. IOR10]|uniref:restriction endonuclease subunit S n=1 Tax=Fusobacterium sp. IOR10 TaxID=2665157 RepID=UPI0013D564C7|nr:restriction endonuclease subunit S [Fusobacterium sp. IOR10]
MKENTEWKEIELGDVIQFNPRESIRKGEIVKKISMDKLKEFSREIVGYEETFFTSGTKFKNGDTLVARITPCLQNGKTAQVNILNQNEIAFGSTEFIVLREIENKTDKDFIYYLSISNKFRDIAIKSMTGTSGRQRAQRDVIEKTSIYLPPFLEQKKIAAILKSLDDKIELNNKMNETLEEMAQTMFKEWFVNFNFPNEEGKSYKDNGGKMIESELGMIPERWRVESLDEIANYLNGLAMQKYRPEGENKLKVIKIKEMNNGVSNESDLCSTLIPDQYKVYSGDILFSWSGTLKLMLWNGETGGLNQHIFKVIPKNFPKWFVYLWTKMYMKKFTNIAKGKATTMGHIKREDLKKAKVVVPYEEELNKINIKIKNIFDEIIKINQEIKTLSHIRDFLLPKLMSGEIRVK